MSPEAFEKQLTERAICEEVLDRELRPRLGITPEKVRAHYDANPGNFRQPERIRLQQIVFSLRSPSGVELSETDRLEKKNLATRLSERLRKGEDFATLAP
jgi:predicted kinase